MSVMGADYNSPNTLNNGRYTVIKKLGEGGKGIVFKCMDNNLGRLVALKLIKGDALDTESYSRIMREAKTTARLSHPNIMSIYDMLRDDGKFYMVVEYVEGQRLDSYISNYRNGMPLTEVLRVSMALASALEYAHDHGVLHRDIKPENVMISAEGVPKLMDFGLAKSIDSPTLTHAGTIVGTPAYLSPETALGRDADARSDLYSLGCVIYQMATGQPPFASKESLKLIYSHIHDIPVAPSKINNSIPQSLDSVIMKLLRKNPDDRFQSAGKLLQTLNELARSEKNAGKGTIANGDSGNDAGTSSLISRKTGGLIGLDEEISTIRNLADIAKLGDGRTVAIIGETGQGKSRLADDIRDYAMLRGFKTITVKGRDNRTSSPLYFFTELMRGYLYMAPPQLIYKICGNYADVAVKLLPEIATKVGPVNELPGMDQDVSRSRFHDGIVDIMKNMSAEAPLAVIFEDLQFADQGTVNVLHTLLEFVERMPLLLVLTVGVPDEDAPSSILEKLYSNRSVTFIRLHNLDRERTTDFIVEFLSEKKENVTSQFVDFVYSKTDGNPLYIEEVLKLLIDKKLIFKSESGSWDRKPISELGVPSSLKGLIKERLAGLDDFSIMILEHASIIGQEFDIDILSELVGDGSERFLDTLEKLIKKKILSERRTTPGNFRLLFTNPQIYAFFYDDLSLLRKRRMHLKVGQIIEARYGDKDSEYFGDLAHHYLEGGDIRNALKYRIRLGDLWASSYEFQRASDEYHQALELMDHLHKNSTDREVMIEKGKLLLKYARNLSYTGANAYIYADRAFRIFNEFGLVEEESECLHVMMTMTGPAGSSTATGRVKEILERTVKFVEKNESSQALRGSYAMLKYYIAAYYWYDSQLETAREHLEDIFSYYRDNNLAPDPYYTFSRYFSMMITPIRNQKDMDTFFEILAKEEEEVGRIFSSNPDRVIAAGWAVTFFDVLANQYFLLKQDVRSADEKFSKGLSVDRNLLQRHLRKLIMSEYLFMVPLQRGDWDVIAFEMERERLKETEEDRHVAIVVEVINATMDYFRGNGAAHADELTGMSEARSLQFVSFVLPILVRILIEEGKLNQASVVAGKALERIRNVDLIPEIFTGRVILTYFLVRINVLTGNREAALRYLSELEELSSLFSEHWIQAYHSLALSTFEEYFGDLTKAIALLRKSAEIFRSRELILDYAVCSYGLALMYQKKGEREKSDSALNEALTIFNRLDCRLFVEKCLGLKELLKA